LTVSVHFQTAVRASGQYFFVVRKLLLFALVAAHLVVLPQSQVASAANIDGFTDTTFATITLGSAKKVLAVKVAP